MPRVLPRLSNPLDWRPIERQILLGSLLMLAPVVLGGWLLATMLLAPEYLDTTVAQALLVLFGIQAVGLVSLLLMARARLQTCNDWHTLENFVIGSFVFNVLAGGYASGTHFTQGLLILLLGFNIASALARMRKIYIAYLLVCVLMLLLAIADFLHLLPVAPLFRQSPFEMDGRPSSGWLAFQVMVTVVLLAIIRISIAVINRWVERENLYREMSSIDGLTRLSNRRSFIERGETEIQRAQRTTLQSVACVMVDLDHFKSINDTWGHHAGDQVLVAASAALMDSTRQYDEVGRYGGEEFAILMPGLTLAEATTAAERIRERIAATRVQVDGQSISITASLGVSCFPANDVGSLNDLLKAADLALYQAKQAGRNRVVTASSIPSV